MKKLLFIFALFAGALSAQVEQTRLLMAIGAVETHNRDQRGALGELTRYQILPATWARFSAVPMEDANSAQVEIVARIILREITEQLEAQGLPLTAHNYALRWNAGARAHRFTPATWIYANKVNRIYSATEDPR